MARRLIAPQRRLRGVARRLRALQRWPLEVAAGYPDDEELRAAPRYWNWKLPVDLNLVESRWTTDAIRRACAQSLIDACAAFIAARGASDVDCRVTCVVCLPDLFTSELCLYRSEDYFRSHTSASEDRHGRSWRIEGRRLSQEWGLQLPDGLGELGLGLDYADPDSDWRLAGERWYFGEIGPRDGRPLDAHTVADLPAA